MNDSEHHPKVKVTAILGSPVFVAGGDVYGKIEIESRADTDLGLRCIFVELNAVEQLTSKYHAATSQFIDTRRLFQGPSLPPSNAVRPRFEHRDNIIPVDYYPARKGITSFLFKLPLPVNAPSSLKFGGNLASITYLLKAGVEVFWRGERRQVVDCHDIVVVESPPADNRGEDVGVVIVGEGGKIWTHGRVLERTVIAGQPVTCRLHVKNNSLKKISGLSVKMMRKLHLEHPPTDGHAIEVSDTQLTVPFNGPQYTVQSFSEGIAHLVVTVPRSARGVRQGPREVLDSRGLSYMKNGLFHIQCYLVVSMSMGLMASGIEIPIPVQIYHPSAVPEILRIPSMNYMEPTGVAPHDPAPLPPPEHLTIPPISPTYSGYPIEHYDAPMFYAEDTPLAPQWSLATSPPPASPQHQFYFDAYSETDPQFPTWERPSAEALIEPPPSVPPRPLSAGPPISQSALLEMPYALPYPEGSTFFNDAPPLHQMGTLNNEPPARVESVDDRASRISRHLRLTSRHRSVSPPRARRSSIVPGFSPGRPPPRAQSDLVEPAAEMCPVTPSASDSPSGDQAPLTPPLFSPRPRVTSGSSYIDSHSDDGKIDRSGTVQRSPQVVELERIVVQQTESTGDAIIPAVVEDLNVNPATLHGASADDGPALINKTLPKAPSSQLPTAKYSTAARGLPAAAFGESTVDSTIAASTALPPTLKPQSQKHAPSGLSLLERRLGRPAAYDIFSEHNNRVTGTMGYTMSPKNSDTSIPARNQPRKGKTQNARPVKSNLKDRRLDSDARVTAWLRQDEGARKDDETTYPDAERSQSASERMSNLGAVTGGAAESPRMTVPPGLTRDTPTPPGFKAGPRVAVSSGVSQLDWRTLNREKFDYNTPTDASPSQPSSGLLAPDPETRKHDVRSARGGKGGIVTSAAAFWSGVAALPNGNPSSTRVKDRGRVAAVQPKPNNGFMKSVLPLDTLTTPSPPRATASKPHFTQASPASPAAGIISNALAKPVLSSSASLAKSSKLARQHPRMIIKPSAAPQPVPFRVTEYAKPLPPAARSDMTPLGRERLRELISRYQNLV